VSGPDRPTRLRVARIVRPHALAGEVVVRSGGLDAGALRALARATLVRDDGRVVREVEIRGARPHGTHLLVLFTGVTTVDQAAELRGLWLEADRSSLPDAGPNQIYQFDLLGLEVVDESGTVIGRVRAILPTGAHEVLEVAGEAGDILIPYHAGTVLGWDPAARRMTVRLPDGLLDVYRQPPKE
jgi:16S rRNA processing protein RimM